MYYEQQWPETRANRSHTSSIEPEHLAERIYSKSQSSFLNINFLNIIFRPFASKIARCSKVCHRTYPVCDTPLSALSRSARRYRNDVDVTVVIYV